MRITSLPSILLLCGLLTACGANAQNEALIAQHGTAVAQNTQISGTATVQDARMQTTLDYVETRVAMAATQSQFLKATLIATGFDANTLDQFQQDVSEGRIILPTPTPNSTQRALSSSAPLITPDAQQTPLQAEATSEIETPRLDNIVMAAGVRDDDCADRQTGEFQATSPEIYVVATAYHVPPGTKITSRWRIGDTEKTFDFTPDFEINGACIWFFVDQTDFSFVPGTWSVTLELNGVSATAAPVQFRIAGDAASATASLGA